ncbi:hypothetical protein [Zavarzinella formosa]|uniref:hypothetical protein n=1 Tax=Zavarzinella formosa TaxID=360055 RepID=UPI000308034D|nr:hypothetical protein [Zavarzinella formosa]
MTQSRVITVNTKLSKEGTRIFAAPSPCSSSGSGGGGDCKVLTGNCPEPISCCMLATFGGSLAGIPPITLVYYPPGDYWGFGGSIGSPVVTPCGTITILEFISGGPAGFQLSLALNTFTSIATGYHTAGCPRSTDPGTYFIWESGDQVADAGSCAGTFTVTITETSCDGGGGSGSTGDYRIGVDTLLTKGGERIFAAVNCAASGPAAYRIGRDTGLSKGGKRIFAAELDPCCDGGPPTHVTIGCAVGNIVMPARIMMTLQLQDGSPGPWPMQTSPLLFKGHFMLGSPPGAVLETWIWDGVQETASGSCHGPLYFRLFPSCSRDDVTCTAFVVASRSPFPPYPFDADPPGSVSTNFQFPCAGPLSSVGVYFYQLNGLADCYLFLPIFYFTE